MLKQQAAMRCSSDTFNQFFFPIRLTQTEKICKVPQLIADEEKVKLMIFFLIKVGKCQNMLHLNIF